MYSLSLYLELYKRLDDNYHMFQASLQLATAYECHPSKAIECLQEAEALIISQYGLTCPLMLKVLQQMAHVHNEVICDSEMALKYYRYKVCNGI